MVETRSGKMQDPAQERIQAEESAKPQPGATIGRDASSDPVVLNPNIDIPKYDGTEDPRPWIESLEEIGFLYHWADYIISRYAAMNMTGSAKTWLNLHKASFTSWENIKIRLIQDFSLDANKEELRMKLNRMQHWNEPAIRFAEDILVLCNKVDPAMEEETKIEHVIGGLKKEYSFALYLNPPKTTDDLLVVCKKMDSFEKKYRERVEKSRNLYNGPRYSRPQQQSRYVPPTAARNYQTTSRPQAPVSNNYKNDSPPTPRHYRNNFPQPSTPRRPYNPNFVPKPNLQRNTYNKSQEVSKNRTEDGRPICFKCNKPGHVARYCRVKFIRILEEDPADTQERVEEKCQMNEISEKSGPRLYADIGTFEALVDTGADLSVVDLRTALDTGHGISKLAKICAGPDGKKLDMVGSIFLNIKIDDETLSHNFVILKTHLRTLILGRDFLKKMNAKIDCKQETIKYDLTNNHDEINFEMLKIKSAKDSIVPECSMKLIKALVETEDGEYIIEESSKMFQTNGLRLARSLINVINRETHIWITNPYPRPLKIMKNQTLAFGSSPAKINVSREREVEKNEEPRFQINENLSPKEQKELKQVLERYGDLFSSRLGRTNLAKHRIDTEDAKPIKHKPYRVSAKERDIIKEQIDEMLTEGIIRPSSSPWSFPVILVKKRDGKYRFCVDYRKLNNVTVKDVYPIPRIDEVMDTLQGSTHFSAIDLRSAYWQVEVEERDKEKAAFTTAHGLYEFNVMPFGLCNAPATFERNMENMLGNLRWQICLCYLDDVIIYSPDFPTHLKRLEAVFRCFRESNLRLNDKKCRFAFEELEILGYITSKHGIKPAEHNIKAVRNFPRPKKVKEVQSFLGMCSYYRKFIKDFSKIADPLTNLIKKSVSFTWTERQEEAFQTLKTALLSPPILGHFNPNAPTYVHTDASNIGIGATLVQDIGGEEKVISYLSRTLSKAEQNYSTTEKECLAVVWSMSKLRPYLYGRHFKIVTDHHALCWLKNLKDPTGRLARWALKIQEYDFDIIHKSGKKHLDADGLSRGPLPETDWDEDFERLFLNQITDEEDKFIESVKKNLNGSRRSIAQNFKEEDGCLFKKNPNPEGRAWLLVVPENKKREIMKEYHNHMSNGHLGVARTMYRIKSKYFWPSMLKDVSEFVKTCHLCQSRKGSNQLPSGLLQPIPPANFPFERIEIDFVGPLPSTKNRKKWIIVLTDYYTRYAETRAVSEATVKEVSKFLVEDIFLRHGAPQYLISDRGSQFTSNLMKEVMKTCKIKHCFTTSYHPQTNGLTERLNRTLINMLSMYVNTDQKNWDEILPFITHAYNTTIQETTGYSPFFLMFGREPTSLLDDRNISVDIDKDDYDEYIKHHLDKINRTRKLVINNTIKTQERMKKNYDKKHMERSYEPGELVAVWTPIRKIGKCEKLLRKYFGPYRILKKLSNVNYLIEPKDNPGQDPLIVHVSRLKPYFERIDEVTHEDDQEEEESVQRMVFMRTYDYRVKYATNDPPYVIKMRVEDTLMTFEIDTGSCLTLISEKDFKRYLPDVQVKEAGIIVKTYDGTVVPILGEIDVKVDFRGTIAKLRAVVVRGERKALLGREWINVLKIGNYFVNQMPLEDTLAELLSEHQVVFGETTDPIKGFTFAVNIQDVNPIFHKARPVPFAIRTAVNEVLERMVEKDYLYQVPSSKWATPVVVVPKKNKEFRICCDFKVTLNRFLDTAAYPLPTQQDLFFVLARGKYFSKLDLSNAYLQLEYLGHLIKEDGIRPLEDKIQGLQKAKSPTNVSELRSFLGLVNYYGKFIPNLPELLEPLHKLLKKNSYWKWTGECEEAISECKRRITSEKVLVPYDATLPLSLATDASQIGVGAVLSHVIEGQEKPIMFASRTLSGAERNYSQIEREALAIIYGVTKFHQFIYGRQFTLITDHKPLVSILGPRAGIPTLSTSRLQRWGLTLAAYTYEIKFRRTQDHGNADLLSGLPVESDETPVLNQTFILSYVEDLPVTAAEIGVETKKYEVLSVVKRYTQQGWPERVGEYLRPYFQRKLELTMDGECLLWGMRVIILSSLRKNMLSCLHETHSGMGKMKAVARSHFWWPNLDNQIECMVNGCKNYQQTQTGPSKVNWRPWVWATRPWQRIHMDFAFKDGVNLLIVVDSHSKWVEAIPMREITARKTIEQLRRLFSAYGLPEEVESDNGPQFTGVEMKSFFERNGVRQTLIPAYHPQSNGLAERAVQLIKMALEKIRKSLKILLRLYMNPAKKKKKAYKPIVNVADLEREDEMVISRNCSILSSSTLKSLHEDLIRYIASRTEMIKALATNVENLTDTLESFAELDEIEEANKPKTACRGTQTCPAPSCKETSSQTDPIKPATPAPAALPAKKPASTLPAPAPTKRKQSEAPNPPAKRTNLNGPSKPAPSRVSKPAAAQVILHGEKSAAHTVVISDDPQADPREMLKAVRAAHTLPQGVWASLHTKGKLVLHSSNPDTIPEVTTSLASKLNGMKVRQQKKVLPRICLFKVDEETSNSTIEETFLETAAVRKLPGDKVVRVAHRSAPRSGTCTAFIEVDLKTFRALGVRGRIVVDGVILNFEESIRARVCFRCCGFGHNSAQCSRASKCFHCGQDGHEGRACPSIADQRTSKCANCCSKGLPDKHEARASSCPIL
ncbi:hypothetical protein LAZ67_11000340, partial [Cordylochernes scorpioides]